MLGQIAVGPAAGGSVFGYPIDRGFVAKSKIDLRVQTCLRQVERGTRRPADIPRAVTDITQSVVGF